MMAGKNSGPALSRLWTRVHETFGQCRRPFVLSIAIARFVQKIFAIKLKYRSRRKPNTYKSFLPPILGGTRAVLRQIVSVIYRGDPSCSTADC